MSMSIACRCLHPQCVGGSLDEAQPVPASVVTAKEREQGLRFYLSTPSGSTALRRFWGMWVQHWRLQWVAAAGTSSDAGALPKPLLTMVLRQPTHVEMKAHKKAALLPQEWHEGSLDHQQLFEQFHHALAGPRQRVRSTQAPAAPSAGTTQAPAVPHEGFSKGATQAATAREGSLVRGTQAPAAAAAHAGSIQRPKMAARSSGAAAGGVLEGAAGMEGEVAAGEEEQGGEGGGHVPDGVQEGDVRVRDGLMLFVFIVTLIGASCQQSLTRPAAPALLTLQLM